jgi:hypothetical protein
MATLHVRNVPDPLYERLREHAEANGRSIGAEAVQLLEERLGGGSRRGLRRRRGPQPFDRFGAAARALVPATQEEARALNHAYIGTEHLLLAYLRERPLAGLTHERAQDDVVRIIGRGDATPEGQIPFTARAKKVLELAVREAHPQPVRPEHVVLGLLREGEGLAAKIVHAAEPSDKELRRLLHAALEGTDDEPPFRVVELDGGAGEWADRLNDAAADGYELVSVVERRAVLRHA